MIAMVGNPESANDVEGCCIEEVTERNRYQMENICGPGPVARRVVDADARMVSAVDVELDEVVYIHHADVCESIVRETGEVTDPDRTEIHPFVERDSDHAEMSVACKVTGISKMLTLNPGFRPDIVGISPVNATSSASANVYDKSGGRLVSDDDGTVWPRAREKHVVLGAYRMVIDGVFC